MNRRRINGSDTEIAVVGGLAVLGYFLILKPIMNLFGGNPEDKQTITDQVNQVPATNFFSPLYQPFVDNFNANPSFNEDGSKMTMQQFFQTIKVNNDNGNPILLNGVNIAALGDTLQDDLSPWVLATDQNKVLSVFTTLTNKTEVSSLAAYVYYNYGKDLFTELQGSIFKVGLSESELSSLINRLDQLPD